jgi:hypothetical protein
LATAIRQLMSNTGRDRNPVWTSPWGRLGLRRPGMALVVLSVVKQRLDAVWAVLRVRSSPLDVAAAVQPHASGLAQPDWPRLVSDVPA